MRIGGAGVNRVRPRPRSEFRQGSVAPRAAWRTRRINDFITDDAIADQVGINGHQFTHVGAWNNPATAREGCQTVACRNETIGQLAGGARVELLEIEPDGLQMGQRRVSPDDFDQRGFGVGRGRTSGVPQDFSHSTTFACGTVLPALYAASASASRRASSAASGSVSKIDFVSFPAMAPRQSIGSYHSWR
jgi:hypothetical protein